MSRKLKSSYGVIQIGLERIVELTAIPTDIKKNLHKLILLCLKMLGVEE